MAYFDLLEKVTYTVSHKNINTWEMHWKYDKCLLLFLVWLKTWIFAMKTCINVIAHIWDDQNMLKHAMKMCKNIDVLLSISIKYILVFVLPVLILSYGNYHMLNCHMIIIIW